ncbi:uncharacterized protein LOC104417933 [Eucalyptus grandis]|uniref:uncharacterized protein LOC104417933 n=1 Tax=Eucalyptus grandis TaxID=71139 RepID=UPI00192EC50F|nr:uncharacterized protein LOC104417933 [Eucalyptus grandis]
MAVSGQQQLPVTVSGQKQLPVAVSGQQQLQAGQQQHPVDESGQQQLKIIKLLIECSTVHVKNFQGKTALEIFQENPNSDPDVVERFHQKGRRERRFTTIISLSQFYSREPTFLEKYRNWIGKLDNSSRETVLIVSTLVAAATYQAGLAPPKGYWQDSSPDPQANSTIVTANSSSIALGKPHQAGDLILSGDQLSEYTIMNGMAFFASIAVIGACALTLKDRRLASAAVAPIMFLCYSYLVTFRLQIPKTNKAAEFSLATAFLLFWFGWLSLFIYAAIKLRRDPRRIDGTWRRVKD